MSPLCKKKFLRCYYFFNVGAISLATNFKYVRVIRKHDQSASREMIVPPTASKMIIWLLRLKSAMSPVVITELASSK